MIVVPTYNMILAAEANIFYPLDQIRRSAGARRAGSCVPRTPAAPPPGAA